jgi:hypothetical protein
MICPEVLSENLRRSSRGVPVSTIGSLTAQHQHVKAYCPTQWLGVVFALLACFPIVGPVYSNEPTRCVVIECYYRSSDKDQREYLNAVDEFLVDRGGIVLAARDVTADKRNQERLDAILRHFRIDPTTGPVLYGCNRVIHKSTRETPWKSQLEEMLQLEVFVRTGCSRCAAAKEWLPKFVREYPGLKLVYRDIAVDASQATRFSKLVEKHRTAAASVPAFHLCDSLIIGFQDAQSTGERLRNQLKRWTRECPKEEKTEAPPKGKAQENRSSSSLRHRLPTGIAIAGMLAAGRLTAAFVMPGQQTGGVQSDDTVDEPKSAEAGNPSEDPALPLPGDDLPIGDVSDTGPPGTGDAATESTIDDQMDVPVFGRLSARKLGMPIFTIAVGLVDGFNPCAMWVLMFLLSILVNLKDRRRIFAIAGTFVIVSGLAYFAFMAAWLNVFMLIGYLRPIQVALALMAILIGSIHVKDFFAFKKGISLSIPESAKPGIYARVRSIVTAEHLTGAVVGAITLAILVNVVELLCTAGLPALYTNILMQQGFSASTRYAFLALYILAYMFDDGLMVLIVVWTLSKTKLQETQGRWLKLLSGVAILLLGIIMLLRPELLH